MDIRISPSVLKGTVDIPSSKSCAHRAIICAALSSDSEPSVLSGISFSKDIEATLGAMEAFGAKWELTDKESGTVTVYGIGSQRVSGKRTVDCNESGSTLRFVIPIAAALGYDTEFLGRGRLPQRPIDIYTRELGKNGITFNYNNTMPFDITGQLRSGTYEIEGNVSSQFITGLLFALPMLEGDSVIKLTSHLESRPYVDITIDTMKRFGISVEENEDSYTVRGGQKYRSHSERVEGDYSQAAFFCVANAVNSQVELKNLLPESVQGDRRITDIVSETCSGGKIGSFRADCSDIPDLVPILSVLAAYGSGESVIYNAQRLRIKESDRLETTAAMLNALGGDVSVTDDGLIIRPTNTLSGGTVDGCGDHRIVMAASIAALGCTGDVVITGAEAVEKSYPDFFKDYTKLGGKANVIDLE
ncbi:MAG: 3-phosphoshikimate 1-carboxyvinyltransferase [Ruminococcus sp.]|nr:3-phosphoshikimate 1-carboxyvinyltransferase [Ruminococcus sp.]